MQYSVILGVTKNINDIQRIKKVLDTIYFAFEYANIGNYEIIFSYMNKKDEILNFEDYNIFKNYKIFTIQFPKNELYSKSIQYNSGIRNAKGKYIICGDLDICWRKNVIVNLNEIFKNNSNTLIGSSFSYLKENYYSFPDIVNGEVNKNNVSAQLLDATRLYYFYGNFQAFPIEAIQKAQGYDERMRVWGEDDNDLFIRLRQKLELKALPEISNYHLFHQPRVIEGNFNFDEQLKLNKKYRLDESFIKNDENWGTTSSKGWNL